MSWMRSNTSLAWKYFKKNVNSPGEAQCTICKKSYKRANGTSNLIEHLRRMHSSILKRDKTGLENEKLDTILRGLELQKRWKGIQDDYVKEVKKMEQVKSESEEVKSSYLYLRRLQFLQPTKKKNSTESNFETVDVGVNENLESSTENLIEEDSSRVPNEEGTFKSPLQQRKKIKLHPGDEHFKNIIEKSLNQRNTVEKNEDDEDKLFCLSLYKEIKKVPDAMRLKTKIEIYNLLLINQSIQTHPQPPSNTDISKSNHVSTSYSQQNTHRFTYPQYDRPNYTTIPYDTLRHNQSYTQFNQKMEPLQTPSPLSINSEISQESSDLDLFG